MLMEEGTDNDNDDILVQPNTIVMSCDPTDASQNLSTNAQEWIRHVLDVLKRLAEELIFFVYWMIKEFPTV